MIDLKKRLLDGNEMIKSRKRMRRVKSKRKLQQRIGKRRLRLILKKRGRWKGQV